jgi:hypothetical protein
MAKKFLFFVPYKTVFDLHILRAGVEKSIVNAPLVSLQSKNANNAKSEVRLKQLIRYPDL